ncbi:MAG: hypothetical protein HC923_04820 [Myxococcales bacterium]|nr:hypothetical protein [Myxococcales bacterium]
MTKRTRTAFALAAALVSGAAGEAAFAQEEYTVSEYAFRRLQRAQEALEAKEYSSAHGALKEMSERESLSAYEQAKMWQTWAYVYVEQGALPTAAEAMRRALDLGALPPSEQVELRFNTGQVLLAAEKFTAAAQVFSVWASEVEKPTAEALYTAAVAFAQAKQYEASVRFSTTAIRSRRDAPDSWLQLALAGQVQLQQWRGAVDTMSALVERKMDDAERWKQLSALYAEANQLAESVATLELAFRLNVLRQGSDVRLLIQNLIASDLPLKAAQVLEDAFEQRLLPRDGDNLELLANALVAASARRRAIEVLSETARRTNRGDVYSELGRMLVAEKEWSRAAEALSQAVSAGGLREPGQTYILLGMARRRLDQLDLARAPSERPHPTTTCAVRPRAGSSTWPPKAKGPRGSHRPSIALLVSAIRGSPQEPHFRVTWSSRAASFSQREGNVAQPPPRGDFLDVGPRRRTTGDRRRGRDRGCPRGRRSARGAGSGEGSLVCDRLGCLRPAERSGARLDHRDRRKLSR